MDLDILLVREFAGSDCGGRDRCRRDREVNGSNGVGEEVVQDLTAVGDPPAFVAGVYYLCELWLRR